MSENEMKETKEASEAAAVVIESIVSPLKDGFQPLEDSITIGKNLVENFQKIVDGIKGISSIPSEVKDATAPKLLRLAGDACYHAAELLEKPAA